VKRLLRIMLVGLVLAGGLFGSSGLAAAALPGSCTDWVHIYSLTGQNPGAWQARITGTDLPRLVNDISGHAFITINDDDGSETLDILWDNTGGSLNTVVTLNGTSPRIFVSITNSTNRYTGCSQTYNLTYRPR